MEERGLLILAAGSLEATLAPVAGGSIARFDLLVGGRRFPVLRGAEGLPTHSVDTGCFPLVPYCNRIKGGSFHYSGREVTLQPNMPPDPSPLHGQGWLTPWRVASSSQTETRLVFEHSPAQWPWRYRAVQVIAIDPAGLSLSLTCTNLSDEPMPCGLGLHPYFPCTSDTRLDAEVQWAWTVDEDVLPVARVPAKGRFQLRDRLICGQDLDNGFEGWAGIARFETPGIPFRTEMTATGAPFFQLYSPLSGGSVAAEPVSHANAALNQPEDRWSELGICVLKPGEATSLLMRLDVVAVE